MTESLSAGHAQLIISILGVAGTLLVVILGRPHSIREIADGLSALSKVISGLKEGQESISTEIAQLRDEFHQTRDALWKKVDKHTTDIAETKEKIAVIKDRCDRFTLEHRADKQGRPEGLR